MVHMYGDHVYEEYGRSDPLPEGYTVSSVFPILDAAVECGDESEEEEEIQHQPDTESQQEGSQEESSKEMLSQETAETSVEQVRISESEMDDQLLHLCIRVFLFILSNM